MIDILKSTIQSRINLVILIILGFMALTDAYSKEVVTNADKSNILQKTTQLLKERKYKPAIQQLEQLRKVMPNDSEVLASLAIAKLAFVGYDGNQKTIHGKNTVEAYQHLAKAVELDPSNNEYRILLAQLSYDFKDYQIAKENYTILLSDYDLRIGAQSRYLVVNYAVTLQELNEVEKSLEQYKESLKVTNYDKRIFWAYMGALASAKKYNEVLEEYKIFENKNGYDDKIKYSVCKEMLVYKQYSVAEKCYVELLSEQKTNSYLIKRAKIDLDYLNTVKR